MGTQLQWKVASVGFKVGSKSPQSTMDQISFILLGALFVILFIISCCYCCWRYKPYRIAPITEYGVQYAAAAKDSPLHATSSPEVEFSASSPEVEFSASSPEVELSAPSLEGEFSAPSPEGEFSAPSPLEVIQPPTHIEGLSLDLTAITPRGSNVDTKQ